MLDRAMSDTRFVGYGGAGLQLMGAASPLDVRKELHKQLWEDVQGMGVRQQLPSIQEPRRH